ncbi:hypothetical protein TEA_017817 [Camellia sinensis var. sinensis]|uniref:Uncharacterized protein n=1 Tax=Camellia sinensis var. sinensis TaxID=542762 RepID=A0A4S4DB26_CAMSN|nr:hypothetical protein TEA_017817 [Camellia sinensis var. sinensis]
MSHPSKNETESRSESNSKGPPIQRKPLKHRDYEVDLDSFGKDSGCYSNSTPKPTGILESLINIAISYVSSRSLCDLGYVAFHYPIQERFELLKKRKDTGPFTEQDFDDRILKQQQEEEERKCQRRERKKEKKKAAEEETEVDADVAAMMGFAGFVSSKK